MRIGAVPERGALRSSTEAIIIVLISIVPPRWRSAQRCMCYPWRIVTSAQKESDDLLDSPPPPPAPDRVSDERGFSRADASTARPHRAAWASPPPRAG